VLHSHPPSYTLISLKIIQQTAFLTKLGKDRTKKTAETVVRDVTELSNNAIRLTNGLND